MRIAPIALSTFGMFYAGYQDELMMFLICGLLTFMFHLDIMRELNRSPTKRKAPGAATPKGQFKIYTLK